MRRRQLKRLWARLKQLSTVDLVDRRLNLEISGIFNAGASSHLTRRWREMDSNHRYPRERSLLLPRSKLARWNRLAAGTGCRLQRAKVSAYSNVSNGAEREPPILRISLLAGAHARCRAGSAGGRSRPCSPNIPRCAPGLDRIGAVAPVAGLDLALRQVLDLAAQLPRPHQRACVARQLDR
jgi:hypothetical protein